MKKRIGISIAILAFAIAIGAYVPLDLIRHPPVTEFIRLPPNADIISCYTFSDGRGRTAFDGKSAFGSYWRWRRNLCDYDQIDRGPRDIGLERVWSNTTHTSYLVYRSGDHTNAVIYYRVAGWTSGAILGHLIEYEADESGKWRKQSEFRQTSDSAEEAVFRIMTVGIAILIGCLAVLVWNLYETKTMRQHES